MELKWNLSGTSALAKCCCSKILGISTRCSIYNITLSLVIGEFSIDTLHAAGKDSS
jgi:hypothetical protein